MTHDDHNNPGDLTHRQMVIARIVFALLFLIAFAALLFSGVVPVPGCCECVELYPIAP